MFENKIYAADSFFRADGKIDTASDEPLTIAFIGGSLTNGDIDFEGTPLTDWNMKWPNTVLRFFDGLFPGRKITAISAGLGGTGSDYGAVRFYRDVLSHNPDIIFIEHTINDCPPFNQTENGRLNGPARDWRQQFLESEIRQCMECEKVPVIIYAHLPYATLPGTELHTAWKSGLDAKEEILNHYGINPINVYESIMSEFHAKQELDPSLDFDTFIKGYYVPIKDRPGMYDVHPHAHGYKFFNLAIVNEIANYPHKYLKRFEMREDYCRPELVDVIDLRYNYIPQNDSRIKYNGDWTVYTKENPFTITEPGVDIRPYSYDGLNCAHGVASTFNEDGKASFEFDVEGSVEKICMPHVSAKRGLGAKVYVNGEELAYTTCQSIYHGMNYAGGWVDLPQDGLKKHIKFVIDAPHDEFVVFRYGYIVEAYKNN